MLVGKRMSSPVVTISPEMPIVDALSLMKSKSVRRFPVVKDGKLLGIVSDKDLLNATPSSATTLSIWEMNYLLSKVKVKEVMTKKVITVNYDTPIEEAARIMADNKIGGLPVMHEGEVIGIITETDLFKIFLELMGAREAGVRVTALVPDVPGELALLTRKISEAGGNFVAFGLFSGDSPENRLVTFKVSGISIQVVKDLCDPLVEQISDIRNTEVQN